MPKQKTFPYGGHRSILGKDQIKKKDCEGCANKCGSKECLKVLKVDKFSYKLVKICPLNANGGKEEKAKFS